MRLSVIINSQARHHDFLKKHLEKSLSDLGIIQFHETNSHKHAIQLSSNSVEQSDIIIAVGGDGHINEVINGIFSRELHNINDSNYFDHSLFPQKSFPLLTFLPAGTGNDYARSFPISKSITKLKGRIIRNRIKYVDLGLIRYQNFRGETQYRIFNNVTDVGIGAFVLNKIHHLPRWLNPNIAYFYAILSTLVTFRYKNILVRTDAFEWHDLSTSIAISKGNYFGSGIGIAPQSSLDNGFFGITILGKVGPKEFLFNLSTLKNGEKIIHPEIIYEKAKRVFVDCIQEKLPIQMDGELIGTTPAEFILLPQKVGILI